MSQPQTIGDAIETRRRSRSTTPLMNLRVSTERENGAESTPGRKVRKTPAVGVIDEVEEQSTGQKAQPAGQTRSTAVRKTRVITSDYSSEDVSPDRVRKAAAAVVANVANMQLAKMGGQLSQSTITTTSTTTESTLLVVEGGKQEAKSVVTVKNSNTTSSGNSSGGKELLTGMLTVTASPKKDSTTSPSKAALLASVASQRDEVALGAGGKRMTTTTTTTTSKTSSTGGGVSVIRTSTPKNAATFKTASTKVVLTPEELQHHAAYKEYLEAGEYWNKYPKTDYTYSELSPHRREVAPGLVAMPNMSRPSLNKHAERVQTMIQRNPAQESFIRERYTSSRSTGLFARADPYDSTEEVDSYLASRSGYSQQQRVVVEQRSVVSRFFLSIVTFCFTCVDSVRAFFRRRDEEHLYYTRIEDDRGFFTRLYGFVAAFFINIFKRIYLLISSVLCLDTWLLQTGAVNTEQHQAGQRKRRFLLFLLVLLPFLLIGGTLLYLDPSALDTVRASLPAGLRNLELKLPNLPNLPAMPEMPSVPLALPAAADTAKQYLGERYAELSALSGHYLEQLKLVTQNSADAVRQLWEESAAEESSA